MNIKKVTAAIFTLLAVLVIMGAAVIFFIASRDEITGTDIMDFPGSENPGVGGAIISHETESGGKVSLLVCADTRKLSEDIYKISIVLNQSECELYDTENCSFEIAFNSGDEIISSYCSNGNFDYFKPQINYPDNKQVVCCDFEGNYADIEIIAKLDSPKEIPINFTYDLAGNGLNFANNFSDLECEMTAQCNY